MEALRFELEAYGKKVGIKDTFNGGERVVKHDFKAIIKAIKAFYKNDVYMLNKYKQEDYANEMVEKFEIKENVIDWLEEVKKNEHN